MLQDLDMLRLRELHPPPFQNIGPLRISHYRFPHSCLGYSETATDLWKGSLMSHQGLWHPLLLRWIESETLCSEPPLKHLEGRREECLKISLPFCNLVLSFAACWGTAQARWPSLPEPENNFIPVCLLASFRLSHHWQEPLIQKCAYISLRNMFSFIKYSCSYGSLKASDDQKEKPHLPTSKYGNISKTK